MCLALLPNPLLIYNDLMQELNCGKTRTLPKEKLKNHTNQPANIFCYICKKNKTKLYCQVCQVPVCEHCDQVSSTTGLKDSRMCDHMAYATSQEGIRKAMKSKYESVKYVVN